MATGGQAEAAAMASPQRAQGCVADGLCSTPSSYSRAGLPGEQGPVKMGRATVTVTTRHTSWVSPCSQSPDPNGIWSPQVQDSPDAQPSPHPTVPSLSHPVCEAWGECLASRGTGGEKSQARRPLSKEHSCWIQGGAKDLWWVLRLALGLGCSTLPTVLPAHPQRAGGRAAEFVVPSGHTTCIYGM